MFKLNGTVEREYQGMVIDRLTGQTIRKTWYYPTWEAAHKAATRLYKRNCTQDDRYAIKVSAPAD